MIRWYLSLEGREIVSGCNATHCHGRSPSLVPIPRIPNDEMYIKPERSIGTVPISPEAWINLGPLLIVSADISSCPIANVAIIHHSLYITPLDLQMSIRSKVNVRGVSIVARLFVIVGHDGSY